MLITILTALLAFLLAYLFALIILRNKNRKEIKQFKSASINKEFVQKKWLEIEATFKLGGPSHFKSSIIEADKLVDYALKNRGIKGGTFGERLKSAKVIFPVYPVYENLWFAHKVRNNIVHEAKYDLNSSEAKRSIEYFRNALKELGVL